MCKLKSAIILKDRVFIPDYDSHTDMLKDSKTKTIYQSGDWQFVKVEETKA